MLALLKDIHGFLFEVLSLEVRIVSVLIILGLLWWWKGLHLMLLVLGIGLWVVIGIILIVFAWHLYDDYKKRKEKLGG